MTPGEFIAKWSDTGLRERAAAQSHFIDLCRLLDEKAPTDADPRGEWYAFEKGAMKTGGGDGWADVWKRGWLRLGVQELALPEINDSRRWQLCIGQPD